MTTNTKPIIDDHLPSPAALKDLYKNMQYTDPDHLLDKQLSELAWILVEWPKYKALARRINRNFPSKGKV